MGMTSRAALALLCVHFDGSGEPLSLDETDFRRQGPTAASCECVCDECCKGHCEGHVPA